MGRWVGLPVFLQRHAQPGAAGLCGQPRRKTRRGVAPAWRRRVGHRHGYDAVSVARFETETAPVPDATLTDGREKTKRPSRQAAGVSLRVMRVPVVAGTTS